MLDPVEAVVHTREQGLHVGVVGPPAAQFAGELDEQRRRVRGSVVGVAAAERHVGRRPEAHLVRDPPRLFLTVRVGALTLVVGEGLQACPTPVRRAAGSGHPRADQRVTAEQRHEPRRTGRDDGAFGMVRVEDAQRAEILDAAAQRLGEIGVAGLHGRAVPPPRAQPARRLGQPHRLFGRVPDGQHFSVDDRRDLEPELPAATGRNGGSPPQHRAVHLALGAGFDVDADRTAADAHAGRPGPVQAGRVRRGVPLLDLEQIGQVSLHRQLDQAAARLVGVVAHRHVLAHAVTDVPGARDQDPRFQFGLAGRCSGEEGGRERMRTLHVERGRDRSVHPQLPGGQQPGVADEETEGAGCVDVAPVVADAEAIPLEEGDAGTAHDRRTGAGYTRWAGCGGHDRSSGQSAAGEPGGAGVDAHGRPEPCRVQQPRVQPQVVRGHPLSGEAQLGSLSAGPPVDLADPFHRCRELVVIGAQEARPAVVDDLRARLRSEPRAPACRTPAPRPSRGRTVPASRSG